MKQKKALLVIDMQKGSFAPETPRFDAAGVVERINALAKLCREKGWPVIFIQHDGTGTGAFEKHTWDWELLDEFKVEAKDLVLGKMANDAFYRSGLQQTLEELGIQELIITGCATDFCVESTIQSALIKDYRLLVVSDAHTTAERPHVGAQAVIGHYNWVWENLMPTKGSIRLLSYKEMSEELG